MFTLELRNGFDSELAEAQGRVSKTAPVMAVLIEKNENGIRSVVDVVQGTMKEIESYFKNKDIKEVLNKI